MVTQSENAVSTCRGPKLWTLVEMTEPLVKDTSAMALWGVWSLFGPQLFGDLVDVTFDLGRKLYERLQAAPDFVALAKEHGVTSFKYYMFYKGFDLASNSRDSRAFTMGDEYDLGHLFLIRAFRAAPASVVAPFSYSSLLWATLFGLLIWGDWPDLWTWAGALIIIGSGLYIFHRERVAHEDR